jgi:hypothetical protein
LSWKRKMTTRGRKETTTTRERKRKATARRRGSKMVAAWDGRVVGVSAAQGKAAGGVGWSPSRTERGAVGVGL